MKKEIKQLKELERLGGGMRLAAEGWDEDWKTLIATLLSARSLDETTIKYSAKLFERYPDVDLLSKARVADVEKIIRPINFYRNKSRNVVVCSKQLVERYSGVPPRDFDKLVELRGVGRKTANVFLAVENFDEIGVDTHVNYISHFLEWTSGRGQEEVERDLKKLFPRKYWRSINYILVKFGKTYTSRREKDVVLTKIRSLK
ncbi:endonuclease III [Candidatus Pacearchaeota archaeon]|nr:endonuclease III [Candidatus Pacearchaeota archaeon]|tara:strand:- start:27046 stop:27651 length:606 start_codon:yes stop_codon:yes gene_type:complete